MPKVTVIIPIFNYGHLVSDAIGSVINQTYQDFEIVVIDDGSTDDTRIVIEQLDIADKKNKLRYFYQINQGLSAARNRGIREAKGEYIALLDADDVWISSFLERMISKLNEGYEWAACDNWTEYIDVSTNTVRRITQKRDLDESWTPAEMLRKFLWDDCIGGPSKVVLRKAILVDNGIYFDTKTNGREDWDFYLQLLRKKLPLGLVGEPLYIYRIRNDGSNLTRRNWWKGLYATFAVVEKHEDLFQEQKMETVLGGHYFRLARRFWSEKRDLKRLSICLTRNIRYKGLGDVVFLLKRKMLVCIGKD